MLKSNELRIGNQIFFRSSEPDNIPDTVITVNIKLLQQFYRLEKTKKVSILKNYYPPIPLTVEILEACGFIRYSDKLPVYDYKIGTYTKFRIKFSKKNGSIFKVNGVKSFITLTILDYLHQLQNLHFSLTGEELKYNAYEKEV